MRILQFGITKEGAGVENAVRLLCRGLADAGHEVLLLTDSDRYRAELEDAGARLQTVDIDRGSMRKLLKSVLSIRRTLKEFAPEVIHVHGRSQSIAVRLAGYTPHVFTLHNSHLTHRIGAFDLDVFRRKYPIARKIIVLSSEAADYAEHSLGHPRERIFIVPNGVDCEHYRPPSPQERKEARQVLGIEPGCTSAIFVGRFHPQKQPDAMIALAAALRDQKLAHVKVLLVGRGELEDDLQREIEDRRLRDICSIHDWLESPVTAYWAADFMLLPSKHEGFPLAPAEAMACGAVVVRTRTGGHEAMIRDGVTGYLTGIDIDSVVTTAMDLLTTASVQPDIFDAVRQRARRHAENCLSVQLSVRRTVECYTSATSAQT